MDKKYLAGYFDGEGYIGLYWSKPKKSERYRSGWTTGCWGRIVGINNTYAPILQVLHKIYGGTFRRLRAASDHNKTIYSWSLGSRMGIEKFLNDIMPFLREKKSQARLMLQSMAGIISHQEAHIGLKQLKHHDYKLS